MKNTQNTQSEHAMSNTYDISQGCPVNVDAATINGRRITPLIKFINALMRETKDKEQRNVMNAMISNCTTLENEIRKLVYFKEQHDKVISMLEAIGADDIVTSETGVQYVDMYESVKLLKDEVLYHRKNK